MSERKANDAEVQRVVRHFSEEGPLRDVTKSWSPADFVYGLDRLDVDTHSSVRERVREILRVLRSEREAADIRVATEEDSARRHAEAQQRLAELKKPHWSIVPNFWMTFAILVLTAIGAAAAVLALFRR